MKKINLSTFFLFLFFSLLLYSSNINTISNVQVKQKITVIDVGMEAALVIIDSSPILLEVPSLLFYSSSAYLL